MSRWRFFNNPHYRIQVSKRQRPKKGGKKRVSIENRQAQKISSSPDSLAQELLSAQMFLPDRMKANPCHFENKFPSRPFPADKYAQMCCPPKIGADRRQSMKNKGEKVKKIELTFQNGLSRIVVGLARLLSLEARCDTTDLRLGIRGLR
jgi:hypothetical protein